MTAGAASVNLWKGLQDRLAFTGYVPVPVADEQIEEAAFLHSSGEPYYVLKQREKLTYLSLPPDAYALWQMMDGTKPVRTIAIEYALAHKRMVTGLLRGLVDELREKGFLQDQPARIFSRLDERRQRRTPGYWLLALLQAIVSKDLVTLRRGDALIGALYQAGGWLFFTSAFAVVMVVAIVAGFGGWLWLLAYGPYSLVQTGDSYLLGFVSLLLLDALATTLHELGHALGLKHARRQVNTLGVLLYYGTPCAYVNTTDVWMAEKRHRIITSLAGPCVSLTLAAVASLVALSAPSGSLVGDLAFKAATIWFFDGLINFIPLLELDGYFVLVDLLEMPLLRSRSFAFLRRDAWHKVRTGAAWTREERILGWFGIGAAAFSGLMLGLTIWAWNVRGVEMATELWTLPDWYGKPLLVLFLLVFAGPLILGVLTVLANLVRALWAQLVWRVNERLLTQRAEPILAALPYLRQTTASERTALAQHLRPRRIAPGAAAIVQGDPADGFYVIRSGTATVEQQDGDGRVRRVATLGPGDHFGELAYLSGAPRNATVRARTALELFYLDGGHFRRWIEEDMQGRADVQRRLIDHATLERLPLLSGLTPAERGQAIDQIEVRQYGAGEVVFHQGEPGDRLYTIVEGRLAVLVQPADAPPDDSGAPDPDGQTVAELGAGDYFGEIALLDDGPRTATVRALVPSTCYALSREGFWRLLEAAPSGRAGLDRLARERIQETGDRLCGAVGGTHT